MHTNWQTEKPTNNSNASVEPSLLEGVMAETRLRPIDERYRAICDGIKAYIYYTKNSSSSRREIDSITVSARVARLFGRGQPQREEPVEAFASTDF